MAKTRKPNYDHFEKKGLRKGDLVALIAEVNGMLIGTQGKIVDEKVMADGGAHMVEITSGPKIGTTHYILARDLSIDAASLDKAKAKQKTEEENARERKALGWDD